jgi:hypothetical protein
MDISPADIIEEVLDSLMMSDLAEESSEVKFQRLSADRVLLDFGLPGTVFTLTVEAEPRPQTSETQRRSGDPRPFR